METDKEVLELCKSWFEDIAERSDRLTSGNVSHCGRAIHGVAMHYSEYVDEYLHNSDRGHKSLKEKRIWKPTDEQIISLRWMLNKVPYCRHKEEVSGLLDQITNL